MADEKQEKIRVVLKTGQVVEYAPELVDRVEIDTGDTSWWLHPPQSLWWFGGSEAIEMHGMKRQGAGVQRMHAVVSPSNGNSWWLHELDSGYRPKKGPFDE